MDNGNWSLIFSPKTEWSLVSIIVKLVPFTFYIVFMFAKTHMT